MDLRKTNRMLGEAVGALSEIKWKSVSGRKPIEGEGAIRKMLGDIDRSLAKFYMHRGDGIYSKGGYQYARVSMETPSTFTILAFPGDAGHRKAYYSLDKKSAARVIGKIIKDGFKMRGKY